jgi:type I pantothenate kinase
MKQLESIYYNDLLASIIHDQTATNPIIIGISGNVAVGKSTFAKRLVRRLQQTLTDKKIELICTDDFLFANQVLRQKALFDRKGISRKL